MGLFKKGGSMEKSNLKSLLENLNMNGVEDGLVDTWIYIHEKEIEENGKKRPGRCFELFLEDVFEVGGYSIQDRPYVGDQGIDFIARKDDIVIGVQAKKLKIDATELIPVSDMRDFIGSLNNYEVKTGEKLKGVFITTHYFSQASKDEAQIAGVELVDKEGLVLLIGKFHPLLLAKAYYKRMTEKLKTCPECGEVLIHRFTHSKYWAHPEYPEYNYRKCKYKESIK